MSTKFCLPRPHWVRLIRFGIGSLVSLGLASVMLWGLVSEHEPEAKLTTFKLRNTPGLNDTSIYLELEVTNRNSFRGFNYTDGWVEAFYISGSDIRELNFDNIPTVYQGFRKTSNWNFTLNVSADSFFWPIDSPVLKAKKGYLYMYLYVSYCYKILLWTPQKTSYQWLDTKVYVNGTFDLPAASKLSPPTDFSVALSS